MTAQGGVRQDFLHVRAYNIMHTLTYTSDINFVTPCLSLSLCDIQPVHAVFFAAVYIDCFICRYLIKPWLF